jgi:alkylhydroperoxidase family enzyme
MDAAEFSPIRLPGSLSRDPRALTHADFNKLKKHGLIQSEIVELIAMSGLAVYANVIADATAMEADAIFDQI